MCPLIALSLALIPLVFAAEPTTFQSERADLVVENAKIFLPGKNHVALAIRQNRILAVGSQAEIEAHIGPRTARLDAKGCSVTPGFNDSHVHFLSGSAGLEQVDLSDADSIDAIEAKIRTYINEHPNQSCIVGRGWVYGTFQDGLPKKEQLDKVVADRPAIMKCYDGHTLWVNSKALQAAGITQATPDPEGGIIDKDPITGQPTGVLKENAIRLMDGVVPKPNTNEKLTAIRAGIAAAHRFGITSVLDAGVDQSELELFSTLQKAGQLQLRFTFALSGKPRMTEADADKFETLRQRFPELNIPSVKLFVDGVIEAHTAVLLSEYANRPILGLPETNQVDLNRIVEMLDRRGWQILVHAIGDGGIRMTLDALERAQNTNPSRVSPRRHRLEHIESISAQDTSRFGRLGVIASMQPYHANPNSNIFGVWAVNLGPERASRAWVWKSIRDAGGQLAFGSDWPVVSLDPRLGMHTALTRQTLTGQPPAGFIPEQRLPLEAVIEAYTRGSAFAEFTEGKKGSLSAGMLADVIVWDHDLFSLPINQVQTAKILTTIFDGQIVYQSIE
ncbi:MAG: amidohydrolase [Pirellula sp.]